MDRRRFLSNVGKGLGLASLSSASVASLTDELHAAVAPYHGTAAGDLASNEDFWSTIQQSFSVGRGTINLNNGGVSPSPRIVTEALVRYQWQQEDLTAHTMWQVMQPQLETIRAGLASVFGCDAEEIAITRNASESLETVLMGLDLKSGDEVLSTTQDYPRMLTTLRQREAREGIVLKLIKIAVPARSNEETIEAFRKAITPKTKVMLLCHQINLTGQLLPVKELCALGRSRGIEVVVDGAHSFAQFDFTHKDLDCDYFGVSLHKWMYAPKGTGLLFVRREKIGKVWPLMAAERKNANDIRKFEEIGTHSIAPKLAIGEAIAYHQLIGARRKEERLRYLTDYWVGKLRSVPGIYFNTAMRGREYCAIANVGITGVPPVDLAVHLHSKYRIITTPIDHEEFKGLRITPNLYTLTGELDRFCDIMTRIAEKGLPK
ncbi:MAG: aminotransferase class V-fold PLP-dependent enzyme [Bacteroidetes bacterium]|nr:aminotransferase class V-fold PLP-dependent enzyme [Bacteroidota bacterium]